MFINLSNHQPVINTYTLIEKNGYITISQWLGDRYDIQPDSKLPWFNPNERIRMNEQPSRWMHLPKVING